MDTVLTARTDTIAELINQCAKGNLRFSGPDSLYSQVNAMGYNCNGLYEMVIARKAELNQ